MGLFGVSWILGLGFLGAPCAIEERRGSRGHCRENSRARPQSAEHTTGMRFERPGLEGFRVYGFNISGFRDKQRLTPHYFKIGRIVHVARTHGLGL